MNIPNPAIVTQRAAQPLPRLALWLFCAAYLIPGLIGREPWKNADIAAFGYMVKLSQGNASWLAPLVGGLPAEGGSLVPYWIGAAFIKALGWAVGPAMAARLPFALLLGLVLALTWYTTYHLARTEAARPVAFAFGGEANTIDYARAMADGALLALIATLGLLQLGHETTPELVQLFGAALWLYALASAPYRKWQPRIAMVASLVLVSTSGAPSIAVALSLIGAALSWRSSYEEVRKLSLWALGGGLLAALVATALGAWGWRVIGVTSGAQAGSLLRLLAWFTWPAWPLAIWTLWRWRGHLAHRHISVPLSAAVLAVLTCCFMGASDRALMLGLPGMAVLSAFALPTMQRRAASAIDWFSVFFFTFCALTIWVVYGSLMTGLPAKPAANVMRLAPGFQPTFSVFALIAAVLATVAWLWLVKWRTGRNRHPLWKSLVLPATGVALCWLLLMTLWLPMLDYARSYAPLMERTRAIVPTGSCLSANGVPRAHLAALEYYGRYQVDAVTPLSETPCKYLLVLENRVRPAAPPSASWKLLGTAQRPTDRDEVSAFYERR